MHVRYATTAKYGSWTRGWYTIDAIVGSSIHDTVGDACRRSSTKLYWTSDMSKSLIFLSVGFFDYSKVEWKGNPTAGDIHAEESPIDPTAAVVDDSDDEVHVDSVVAEPTVPPPLSLRAMMETFMTTQAAHGQLLEIGRAHV